MSVIEMKPVRERILDVAIERYYADGIRAVSADRVIAEAHVSKVTFYRHFPTKDALVAAYLEHQAASEREMVLEQRATHTDDPAAVLRWYAEGVGTASCGPGFRGCPFINAAAELSDPEHVGRVIVADHRAWLTSQVAELLEQLGADDAATKADQLMMVRDGAMVAGYVGRSPEAVTDAMLAAGRAVVGQRRLAERSRAGS